MTGTVRGRNEATLSAKITAQIRTLDVRVGDRVKKGQALVRLDASMASISLQNAKATERLALANQANARAELARGESLRKEGALTDAVFEKLQLGGDIASAQVDQARAAIHAASQQISDATITAPFDGVIAARFKNVGDTVSAMPPTPLLQLVDPDHLEVRMSVPEALAPRLHAGDQLAATASPSGTLFQLRVTAVNASIEAASRTVEVIADVVPPLDPVLKPGALCSVDLAGAPSVRGFFLPASAVFAEGGQSFVYIAAAGKVQRRKVDAASIKPGTFLITLGLSADDPVALVAADLHDGDTVRALAD